MRSKKRKRKESATERTKRLLRIARADRRATWNLLSTWRTAAAKLRAENEQLRPIVEKKLPRIALIKAAAELRTIARRFRVIDGRKLAFPLCGHLPGGPLWFSYTCRNEAEAVLLLNELRAGLTEALEQATGIRCKSF